MHVQCMQIYEKLMLHVQIVQTTKDIVKLGYTWSTTQTEILRILWNFLLPPILNIFR